MDARILNAAGKAIKLRLQAQVNEGDTVTVELAPGFSEQGSVLYCRKRGEGFDVVVDLNYPQNRKEHRIQGSEPATVSDVEDPSKTPVPGSVVDLSESGVGLIVQKPFYPGALVSVAAESFFVLGEVRHCSPTRDGSAFRVGVRTERLTLRREEPPPAQIESGSVALPIAGIPGMLLRLKKRWT